MIYLQDLQSFVTKSVKEIEHVMNVGNQNRAVGYVCFINFYVYEHGMLTNASDNCQTFESLKWQEPGISEKNVILSKGNSILNRFFGSRLAVDIC